MSIGPKKEAVQYTTVPSTGYGTFNNWQPPSDWLSLDGCVLGNIELLVCDQELATYAFTVTTTAGNYVIKWGDGTTVGYASGATAQHTYAVGAGHPCSLGYTTFKITISPTSGALKTFTVAPHNLATNGQYHGILSAVFNTPSLTSLAFYATGLNCRQLQSCIITNAALTTLTNMFSDCASLQSITLPPMPLLTTASSMFSGCYSLQSITLPPMPLLTTASSMFSGCYALQSLTLPPMPLLTTATYMFNACFSLQSITLPPMPLLTNATSMFQNCYALQSITLPPMPLLTTATSMFNSCYSLYTPTNLSLVGSSAASMQGDGMFTSCEQMTAISMPNTIVTVLNCAGTSGKPNKLATLAFSPSSTFAYATPPQLDISYCTLTAAQINTIFSSLPNNLAKTVNITGDTGETLITLNGTPTLGSTAVTMASTTGLVAGMEMTGTGINTARSVTFTQATSVVNLTAHGIPNGTLVYFPTLATTTGFSVNTPYVVLNTTANTFQIATQAVPATPITFGGSDGSGTVFYGNPIQTVNVNTSVVLLIPASSSPGSTSTISSTALHSLAVGKGWTITG